MLKKITFFITLCIVTFNTFSQIYDPVKWEFGSEKKSENEFELIFTASIDEDSHIYSMKVPEGGPIPTSFSFDSLSGYKLDGIAYEVTEPKEKFDEAFGFKIKTFSKKAEFRQKITTLSDAVTINGVVNYMACNNVTCSPPKDVEFSISLGDVSKQEIKSGRDNLIGKPEKDKTNQDRGLLSFFLISMLAGFAGVLTPCVFPMIPMTVAFFSQGSENRGTAISKAIIFGLSIVIIYLSLGVVVSLTSAGAGFANALSTHWIPNILFFILFVIFAVSFFGAFEIVLPNSWVAKADSKVDKGGMLASFFLGLTTVIVSFSCTGPIVGVLLVEAAGGDVLRPLLGMGGFGLAFALPFTFFALFPSIVSKIPKSGGWLNSIKVVLAFIMLAFSMKFLVTIDSVYSFGIISRDLFIAIWIVIFSLMGLYLMGKLKFSHDSDVGHIGVFRLFLIIVVFSFVVYLVPGMFGSPLKGLSSLLPSAGTTALNLSERNFQGISSNNQLDQDIAKQSICSEPKYGDIFDMPFGLKGYFDLEQGLECAKQKGKPVLIDFKGHACANCKLMEAKVWSDPEVLKRLNENFVIVALYVDDRTRLPENDWIVSSLDGKQKKTIGKINEDLEISRYGTNALPLYVITDHKGNPLNEPMPTNLNVEEYKQWLDDGVSKYNQNFPNLKVTI